MKVSRREAVANYVLLGLFALFAVFPLGGVLLTAVTPQSEATGGLHLPSSPDLSNFGRAWEIGNFGSYMVTSVIVTTAVVLLTTVLATMAGFAFARMRFPMSGPLFYVLMLGLMLPAEAFIIPLYYNLRGMGLTNTYWALILPQVAQGLGFGTFWMRNTFRAFPTALIEAARLDGAADRRILRSVMVPATKPAILTMCLLLAMWTWNEFLIPLVMVTDEGLRTAPLGMAFFVGRRGTDYSGLAAAGVMVAAPIVLLYILMNRRFIEGTLGGATK